MLSKNKNFIGKNKRNCSSFYRRIRVYDSDFALNRNKFEARCDKMVKNSPDLMIYLPDEKKNLKYFKKLLPGMFKRDIFNLYLKSKINHQEIHLKYHMMRGGDIYTHLDENNILEDVEKIFGKSYFNLYVCQGLMLAGYQFNEFFPYIKLFKTISDFESKPGINYAENFDLFATYDHGIHLVTGSDYTHHCIYDAVIPDHAIVRIENGRIKTDLVACLVRE